MDKLQEKKDQVEMDLLSIELTEIIRKFEEENVFPVYIFFSDNMASVYKKREVEDEQ